MRLRPVFFAAALVVVLAFWSGAPAQQSVPTRTFLDPADVALAAADIAQASGQFKPLFEQVHAQEWVAKGAPEAYLSQWTSLAEQNLAILAEMNDIAQHPDALQDSPRERASLSNVLHALFRFHRFEGDLAELMRPVRRYQDPALANQIESVAAGNQRRVEKLEEFALDLASEKERQLTVVDNEAQRCRAILAKMPPPVSTTPFPPPKKKATSGTTK